ncbi:MAG: acriflavin resistance protein, partial [Myxococcales bacterium]|nr:acriflavin resistance protein [Myxococcales bacterium]
MSGEHDTPEPATEASALERLSALWTLTVDRPVATLMIVVAVSVFGYLSYGQLSLALMPELSYPTLTVRTDYEGAAPEEVEEEITKPLEEILRTVEGLVAIESTSRAGLSDVVLQFHWDSDMDFASQRVRERTDLMALPEGAEKPLLLRYDPTLDPILRIGLHSEANLSELRLFGEEEIARALEKIKGVAMVRVRGGREDIVRIDLDQRRMSQLDLSIAEIEQRLAAENVNLAGGRLRQGEVEYLVRTVNEFRDLDELRKMVVARRGDQIVRLDQIGRVYFDYQDREVLTHINGGESVEIAIFKEADANLVRVATDAREAIFGTEAQRAYVKGLEDGTIKPPGVEGDEDTKAEEEGDQAKGEKGKKGKKGAGRDKGAMAEKMKRQAEIRNHEQMTGFLDNNLPKGFKLDVLSDQSTFIERSIDEVTSTALLGALFAVLILYVFLRSPFSTLIIALAIPLSVVFTFAPMRIMGLTLNIMSLGGLALGVGMLVDNSIVVLESIFRCREEGDGIRASAIRGTQEVGSAVIASTLTTTAVFFPIVFVEGVAGQLFGDLALTVVFSLLASLIVALFVVPMLASRDLSMLRSVTGAPPTGEGDAEDAEEAPRPTLGARVRDWARLRSVPQGVAEFKRLAAWWRRAPTARRVVLAPVVVLGWIYLLAKLLVLLVLELALAKLVYALLFGAMLLVVGAAGLALKALHLLITPALWVFDRGFDGLQRAYPKVLRTALGQRFLVLLCAGALFAGALWQTNRLGMELIPELHQGEFKIGLRLPIGTNLDETAEAVTRLERQLSELPDVAGHSSVVGAEKTATTEGDRGEHSAIIT